MSAAEEPEVFRLVCAAFFEGFLVIELQAVGFVAPVLGERVLVLAPGLVSFPDVALGGGWDVAA